MNRKRIDFKIPLNPPFPKGELIRSRCKDSPGLRIMRLIILTAVVSGMALFNAGCESGAGMLVEIFYLPHAPAEAVVKDVEGIVQKHKAFSIKKYSFDDPENRELVKRYYLSGHMPVAIIINGKNEFTVGDRHIALKNFPKDSDFVPMFEGEWGYQDLEKILQSITGGG